MATTPAADDPKLDPKEDRGDEHTPTPDEEGEDKGGGDLSTDDLAAVAAEGQVPYARFKEVQTRADEAERARIIAETEARVLRERSATPAKAEPAVDLKALRKASKEALLEGDAEKSADIDEQIEAELERRRRIDDDARHEAALEARELRRTAAKVVEQYPWLNSASPERNQDAIDETLALRNVYMSKGMSGADALEKAVKKTVKNWTGKEAEGGAGDGGADDDDLARRRNALALSRGAATAKNQPTAAIAGKGMRASPEGPVDISKLSEAEFAKLPEAEKKKARGDAVG